jgi:hypothetical protein
VASSAAAALSCSNAKKRSPLPKIVCSENM